MRLYFFILTVLVSIQATDLNAQKVKYHFGVHGGMIMSYLSGSDGKMEITFRQNRVKDINDSGGRAYGGFYPLMGAMGGVYGGFWFADRFTLDMSISYLNKGYQDIFQYEVVDTFYNSTLGLRNHFVDLGFKLRYVDRNFIINTGFVIGANIHDQVNYSVDWEINGNSFLQESYIKYMHEHYGIYRKPFVLAYDFGIGWRRERMTFIANMQKTGSFFNESSIRFNYMAYSITMEYRINRLDKRVKRH